MVISHGMTLTLLLYLLGGYKMVDYRLEDECIKNEMYLFLRKYLLFFSWIAIYFTSAGYMTIVAFKKHLLLNSFYSNSTADASLILSHIHGWLVSHFFIILLHLFQLLFYTSNNFSSESVSLGHHLLHHDQHKQNHNVFDSHLTSLEDR